MTEQRSSNSLLVPLVAAAAGASIALLFAPRSGQETRERLKAQAQEKHVRAKKGYESARKQASEKSEQARDMKNRVTEAIKTSPKKTNSNTQDTWEEV